MLTCLVSVNAKSIVEYDYDYVDIWFNKITNMFGMQLNAKSINRTSQPWNYSNTV